ncbi:MAG TPA: hypothetical protein VFU43_02260 [Streptosporangiaceae bacterium]|nr:hypothetical protein [Streptosporangiaceae bacterium]
MTKPEFCDEFGGAFPEAEDTSRRWEMFVTVAAAFTSGAPLFDNKALASRTWTLAGPGGLQSVIDSLGPFGADPQRKKTRILLQQLYRYDLLRFSDPEQLRPAIEHHIIRLYLRTGRVARIGTSMLRATGNRASDIRNLTALRAAVEQAMSYTAAAAELTVNEINEIEWQVGRSYCIRSEPRCEGPCRSDKPVDSTIAQLASGACPFVAICDAPRYEGFARLTEPRLAKHHGFY